MAGEEKLRKIKIRDGNNISQQIPISVDASNITYVDNEHGTRTLDTILSDGLVEKNQGLQYANQFLAISDSGYVQPKNLSAALEDSFKVPHKVTDLTDNEDYLRKDELKDNVQLLIQEDNQESNAFKIFYDNILATNQLNSKINNLEENSANIADFTALTNRVTALDSNIEGNQGRAVLNSKLIQEIDKKINDNIIGNAPIPIEGEEQSEEDLKYLNLFEVKDELNKKMNKVSTVINGEEKLFNSEDLTKLRKITQTESIDEISIGNDGNNNTTTRRVGIWGSPDVKIGINVKNQGPTSNPEKYGLLVKTDGIYVAKYDLATENEGTLTELYCSNRYLPGETINLYGGVFNGFITTSGKEFFFFIPTPKSCAGYATAGRGKRKLTYAISNNNSIGSIRKSTGGYLQPTINVSSYQFQDMTFDFLGTDLGIRGRMLRKNGSAIENANVNNILASMFLWNSFTISFTNEILT